MKVLHLNVFRHRLARNRRQNPTNLLVCQTRPAPVRHDVDRHIVVDVWASIARFVQSCTQFGNLLLQLLVHVCARMTRFVQSLHSIRQPCAATRRFGRQSRILRLEPFVLASILGIGTLESLHRKLLASSLMTCHLGECIVPANA